MWPTFSTIKLKHSTQNYQKPQIKNHEQADKLNEAALNSENMQ